MNIDKKTLLSLLEKAFVVGNEGYSELKKSSCESILNEYINLQAERREPDDYENVSSLMRAMQRELKRL